MNNILYKVAWRNLWRNRRRTIVLLLSVATGVFCFLGSITFMDGFSSRMIESTILHQGGHILVAREGFNKNPTVQSRIRDAASVSKAIGAVPDAAHLEIIRAIGMASTAEQASGVTIMGVDPNAERKVGIVSSSLVEGRFLSDDETNEIVIGAELADRLNARLGEKVVLMANDVHNEIGAGAYRVAGIFKTTSSEFDKTTVFVRLKDARSLLAYRPTAATAFQVYLDPGADVNATADALRAALGGSDLEVLTWKQRFPILSLMQQAYDYSSVILVFILFAAIAFTVVNTFLMVIMERIREFGVMMANGLRPGQVRKLLYAEAIYIVLLGTVLGIVPSFALIWYGNVHGFDLSGFSEGLSSFGIGSTVFLELNWGHILTGFGMILFVVLLATAYPAIKASRLKPVEALRHV